MVRARLGIGLNAYRACPDFLRTNAGKIDGGLAIHARRLGCVWIERMTRDYTDAVMLPLRGVFVLIVAHLFAPMIVHPTSGAPRRPFHCPLVDTAFGGKADMTGCRSPLSQSLLGAKRTCRCALHVSAFDPKRTCRIAAHGSRCHAWLHNPKLRVM